MTKKVRLYLDVDGVINAAMPPWKGPSEGRAVAEGHAYKIRWAPAMVAELAALGVDLVWATTWRKDAAFSIAPLIGWGEDARHLSPPFDLTWPSIDWKAAAVAEDQKGDPSPFIWADDEIHRGHVDAHPDALVLSIDPRLGITPTTIQRMRDYIKGVSA